MRWKGEDVKKRNIRNRIFSACILFWMFGCAFAFIQINTVNAEENLYIEGNVTNIAEDISDVKGMEYRVQEGSYADKYMTEAGEQHITRTGTKVLVTALLIDGKRDYKRRGSRLAF